jgi:hypothetical protein
MILYALVKLFCALYGITVDEHLILILTVFSIVESGVEIAAMMFYIGGKLNEN